MSRNGAMNEYDVSKNDALIFHQRLFGKPTSKAVRDDRNRMIRKPLGHILDECNKLVHISRPKPGMNFKELSAAHPIGSKPKNPAVSEMEYLNFGMQFLSKGTEIILPILRCPPAYAVNRDDRVLH